MSTGGVGGYVCIFPCNHIKILDGLEIVLQGKKTFKLFFFNIGKYFYSIDVRNHKQVLKPRRHERKY